MKPILFFTTLLLVANLSSLQAQKNNVWKGGAPGHENDWHYFKNWSAGKTPDVFDRVIIPDVSTSTLKYPVIRQGEIEVQSLEIRPGASLTLLRPARIVTDEFVCNGSCTGCEQRVLVEGVKTTSTVSQQ
jgi:hypothetical protein